MTKKTYKAPMMEVIIMRSSSSLLAGSKVGYGSGSKTSSEADSPYLDDVEW